MMNTTANAYQNMDVYPDGRKVLGLVEDKRKMHEKESSYDIVSFFRIAKKNMGFRECARLMKIAEQTGCTIRLAAGKHTGSTDSILSFLHMAIIEGMPVVLSIRGRDTRTAFHECENVLSS